MQHRAASRRSLAFGIVFALVAMAVSFLAVLAAATVQAPAAQAQYQSTNQSTTAQTTTAENTATAGANTSNNRNRPANGLRCADILRITRNAGPNQYNISAERIQQCLRKGVLAGTIPNRLLPGTGGPPAAVLGLAALALVSVVAGASVFRAGTRRRR